VLLRIFGLKREVTTVWIKLDKNNLKLLPRVRMVDIFIANTVSLIKEPLLCVLMNAFEDLQILCVAIANTATVI
jgi:hypothetical protein